MNNETNNNETMDFENVNILAVCRKLYDLVRVCEYSTPQLKNSLLKEIKKYTEIINSWSDFYS